MTGIVLAAGAVVAAAPIPQLPIGFNIEQLVVDPEDAAAYIEFRSDGTVYINGASASTWTDKPGVANGADFRVKYDWSSGSDLDTYPAGASDNVYTADISATRTFYIERLTVGTKTSTGTFTVEKISTGETDTASGSFTATVAT